MTPGLPALPVELYLRALPEPGEGPVPGITRRCPTCGGRGEVRYLDPRGVWPWMAVIDCGVGVCRVCSGHGRIPL